MIDKDSLPLDKPRRTPSHPTKSHVVKTRVDGKEKIIRFGEQGAKTAGKPKEGESEAMKQKRASFKARHAKNIAKGKSSPAYWADKVKWATGGSVDLEDLDEKYEGIKKPDFTLLESFRQLIRDLQARAEESGTQEFDPLRALGRSGAAGSLEDLYEAYSDKPAPHASRAEAGAKDPKRTETAKMVFDSFKAAGFSDAQAKALTAEINREGSFNPAFLFGSHTDAANKATNVGMLSWQGDRANRLMSFMADRGLIDPAGRIAPGQDALNAQAEYLRWEMENDPSYTRTRETFLANPDIDQETAHDILGKNFIRWRIDDPKYRGSGFERIREGYDLLNMAQGYAEGGLAELAHKYDKGGKKKDDDELERAKMERQLAEQMQGLYEEDLAARGNVPRARSEPRDPTLLGSLPGVEDRLVFLNQTFNPVVAIGDAMRAGRDLMDPEAGGYDRLAALGNMLSGVAGVAGPAAVAKRIGAPAATAVMESLLGASPTAEALADMGRKYAVDESGALRLYQGSPHDFAAERLVRMPDGSTQYIVGKPDVLPDVPAGAEVLRDFPLGRQRMDKIGTGEGAQAYGYGLYGAENEAIARSYRDALAGTALPSGDPVSNAWDMIHRVGGNDPQMRNMIRESFVDMMEDADPKTAEFARQSVEAIDSGAVDAFKAPGRMYEVEVNANPEDFIDFDAPWESQPEAVKRHFAYLAKGERKPTGEDLAQRIEGPLWAREAAQSGIPGIRYLDAGSRNQALAPYYNVVRESDGAVVQQKIDRGSKPEVPEGFRAEGPIDTRTRNYVIFDENLINIVRKYGIAGAATMLGVSAADVEQAMAQGNVEDLDQKYAEGGNVKAEDEDAYMARQMAAQMDALYAEDLAARGGVPRVRSEPQEPSLMNIGGIGDRLALINKYLNPVEAIGESMDAGSRMMSPGVSGYDRLAALGDMLSGVAGVAGPAAVAKRVGAPAANAVMDALVGGSPTSEAVADMARKYAVDEAGSLPGMGRGLPDRFGENWDDVYHWSRSPEGFSEFDPDKSKSAMSQLGPHVGTQGAAEARYMGFAKPEGTPPAMGFTMPLKADLSKPFLNPATGKPWTEMDLEMFISAVSDVNNIDRKLVAPFMRERLAKEGYTSIPYMNDVEDAGSVSHIMLTERPASSDAVLRSRFAKFDPAMRNAKNLSAGVAAGAIGASQYDPDAIETTASRVRENKFAAGGAVKYDPAAVDGIINKLREVNRG